jgi:hypothetical protein
VTGVKGRPVVGIDSRLEFGGRLTQYRAVQSVMTHPREVE